MGDRGVPDYNSATDGGAVFPMGEFARSVREEPDIAASDPEQVGAHGCASGVSGQLGGKRHLPNDQND